MNESDLIPVDETDLPPYAGEFARHWSPELAENPVGSAPDYTWDGRDGDDSIDFNVWAYGHAEREAGGWSVVVQQVPPAILGVPDAPTVTWGVRFSAGRIGEVTGYEMTPGADEDGVAYVHPHAPRIPFTELPVQAQARVMAAACTGWRRPNGVEIEFDLELGIWRTTGGR